LAFGVEYRRDRIAATFPDHYNNLALAVLVPCKTAVNAIFLFEDGDSTWGDGTVAFELSNPKSPEVN
jgi:hypothetical protein